MSFLDITLNNLMVRFTVILEFWGMLSNPSLPPLPGPLWPGEVASDRALSKGQIEQNCVLILNWIVWNKTALTFNRMGTKTVLVPNWIVWNRTVRLNWINKCFWQTGYLYLNCVLLLNWMELFSTLKQYLRKTESFKIEQFWHLTVCK